MAATEHVQPEHDTTVNTILAPKGAEIFSWKQFSIVMGMHVMAVPALFCVNKIYVLTWLAAHLLFGFIGASLGLHRLFSHRSYAPNRPAFYFISMLATLCFQGGPIFWAASHRNHHRFTESYGDPHSATRGFFWSHIGWLFYSYPNGFSYLKSLRLTSDWRKNKFAMWLETRSTQLNLFFLGGLFIFSYAMKMPGLFFWIGPLRIVTVWHSTWAVNSFAHNAHKKESQRKPGKRLLLSFIIGGEGNHEFHHKHASSVCHSGNQPHLDFGFKILQVMSFLGLVKYRPPQRYGATAWVSRADGRTRESDAQVSTNKIA